ncbi:UDP-N-acetylenolpyruvoylglucosamine reductase [Leptolyngbya sp. BL0902]|uniref:UDP-N-acetylmuramate dehydrogenase n=1 Tax=Leptolyngbya sp. BL0902 TaxID=1115757 RepID=UPI0018E79546|nr:UDP-N-acetylmuramate dehydrogenase [Leptolyngbya sp. BL0902]QQE65878.1 UDP-N-acetylenolpyruvoylglucosamine reductase [Leptolyngbya sp. BL0902]
MTITIDSIPAVADLAPQMSLHKLNTFRVGGSAEWLALPRHRQDFDALLQWASAQELPITVLGAGSNLLVSDQGLPGLVICTRRWRSTQFDEARGRVTVAAGEPLPTLAWKAAKRGWRGLEWAVGIPGTVGGAVVMNAGAHGGCAADCFVSATVLDPVRGVVEVRPQDLAFAYRTSALQGAGVVVLEATFQLEPGHDPAVVSADTLDGLNRRRSTQPYDWPNCGSVFRNPLPRTAGGLIEQSGLKGYRIGNAQVADLHANFILNLGQARAEDVYRLIRYVQEQVYDRWEVWLHPEVKFIGNFPDLGPIPEAAAENQVSAAPP